METISVSLSLYAGTSGILTLWLYNSGVLLNTGGDTLTETSNGFFSCSVDESRISEVDYDAVIKFNGSTVYETILYYDQTKIGSDRSIVTLTTASSQSIAGLVDASFIDGTDGTNAIAAIVAAINNTNLSESVISESVRQSIERAGGILKTVETNLNNANANTSAELTALFTAIGNLNDFDPTTTNVTIDAATLATPLTSVVTNVDGLVISVDALDAKIETLNSVVDGIVNG